MHLVLHTISSGHFLKHSGVESGQFLILLPQHGKRIRYVLIHPVLVLVLGQHQEHVRVFKEHRGVVQTRFLAAGAEFGIALVIESKALSAEGVLEKILLS